MSTVASCSRAAMCWPLVMATRLADPRPRHHHAPRLHPHVERPGVGGPREDELGARDPHGEGPGVDGPLRPVAVLDVHAGAALLEHDLGADGRGGATRPREPGDRVTSLPSSKTRRALGAVGAMLT